ncbi:MAG: VWA domain-containing protein [Gemmatimonadaceae bacterium]
MIGDLVSAAGYFDLPWLLPLAVMLPILAVVCLRQAHRGRIARIARLGQRDVVERLLPPGILDPPRWRTVRLATAAALVGVGVAGPRWGAERTTVRTRGIDLVLALDASLSMLATDERPNRLERMKQEVRRLRALSTGDRVGVLAFAGRSYVLSPLTVDAGALDLFLDNLDPSIVGQAGSSLARTFRQGTDLLLISRGDADKALVVMSDGEAFESVEEIVAEARRAGEQGVSVVTVGFGTEQGSTIPIRENGAATVKRDEGGQPVLTRYHPELLRAAAEAARGTFIPADANDKAGRIKHALANLRTQQRASVTGETRTPRFQWFLAPALALLLLDTLLGERRAARQRRPLAAARRTAPAMAIMLVAFGTGCSRLKERAAGARAYKERAAGAHAYQSGRFTEAAAAYQRAVSRGDRSPATLYNFGTSLLGADSLADAAEALGRAAPAPATEVRYRALFNLGLAHLKRGLALQGDEAAAPLDSALAAYKQVLLLRHDDVDAKWNYELALRKRQSGGGGGASQQQPQPQAPQREDPQPSGNLAQRQAEQLLGSAAREERDVQAKRQRQNRVEPPPGGKDW